MQVRGLRPYGTAGDVKRRRESNHPPPLSFVPSGDCAGLPAGWAGHGSAVAQMADRNDGLRRQRVMMGTRWWAYILALVLVVLLAPAAPAQFADLIDRVRPSVGFILVTLQDGSAFSGSGFVIRSDGYLLSASHVFDGGAKTITVTFPGGRPIPAQVISRDPKRDMAVLKVEAPGLRALPFASAAPRQGDE